ncbi:MAG: hypothetical protein K0S44_3235 [Bacteroidetes bacterium]|nr:hypothetical protein [Bacteroidota bacterium]
MKKNFLKYLLATLFLATLVYQNDTKACHLASLTLVSGPTSVGGGNYQFTIEICTGSGASAMGLTCGTGAVGNTEDYTITANGVTSVVSTSNNSITSGYNGVVSTASVMGNTITYNASSPIYMIPGPNDLCDDTGPITQWCWNVTFITSGIPTSISVSGLENVNTGQNPGPNPCPQTVTVPPCAPPSPPTVTPGARCGPGTVTLSAAGCAGGTISWYSNSAGTGTPLGTGSTFTTPSISATTTYYATCTIGCQSTTTAVVATIRPLPVSNAGANVSICSGASATIGAASTTGTTYSWSPTTGLSSSTSANPTVTLTNTGTSATTTNYTVTTL